jgi:hypothetical protein
MKEGLPVIFFPSMRSYRKVISGFRCRRAGPGGGMVRDWKHAVKKFSKVVKGVTRIEKQELLKYWVDIVKTNKSHQMKLV